MASVEDLRPEAVSSRWFGDDGHGLYRGRENYSVEHLRSRVAEVAPYRRRAPSQTIVEKYPSRLTSRSLITGRAARRGGLLHPAVAEGKPRSFRRRLKQARPG